jgi:hypothetical protein
MKRAKQAAGGLFGLFFVVVGLALVVVGVAIYYGLGAAGLVPEMAVNSALPVSQVCVVEKILEPGAAISGLNRSRMLALSERAPEREEKYSPRAVGAQGKPRIIPTWFRALMPCGERCISATVQAREKASRLPDLSPAAAPSLRQVVTRSPNEGCGVG